MPILNLKIAPLQDPQRNAALARALTSITAQHLGKRQEVTALAIDGSLEEASYVIVRDVPAADWGYGGVTQAARKRSRETAA